MHSRLRWVDLLRIGSLGLGARRLRSALTALGIGIGIASIVGVLGISSSSQAALLAQLDSLGTNLLTVSPGQQLGGGTAYLPQDAPLRIRRIAAVEQVASTGLVPNTAVRRTNLIPSYSTGGIGVRAADPGLLRTVGGTLRWGKFLDPATANLPAVVLGAYAAQFLGVEDVPQPVQVFIAGQWFGVVGVLAPVTLAPQIDQSALIGFPIAERLLAFDGSYSIVYLRADPDQTLAIQSILAGTANPANPSQVTVSRPSDALAARAAARSAYTSLFIGLGAVALLVAGVGIANVMVVSVLERRSEIGLRRALGATRVHVGAQFLAESLLLSGLGGAAGVLLGAVVTAGYALFSHLTVVVPAVAVEGGLGAALLVGAVAGLYPATRAARLAPTEALRTV